MQTDGIEMCERKNDRIEKKRHRLLTNSMNVEQEH